MRLTDIGSCVGAARLSWAEFVPVEVAGSGSGGVELQSAAHAVEKMLRVRD